MNAANLTDENLKILLTILFEHTFFITRSKNNNFSPFLGRGWLFVYEPWPIGERSDRRNFHQMSHQAKEFNQRQQIYSC